MNTWHAWQSNSTANITYYPLTMQTTGYSPTPPKPKPSTDREWLDAELDAVCLLAA